MNRMYEIDEGRPIWKLRPAMLLLTLVLVAAGRRRPWSAWSSPARSRRPSATPSASASTAVTVWNIAKWPVLLADRRPDRRPPLLRHAQRQAAEVPLDQRRRRRRHRASGSCSPPLFGFYVGNFSSYNKTYGSLAGVIVFLLWLWITNLALLFGAELDAELERGRQLQAGIAAEETCSCRPATPATSRRRTRRHAEDVARGRQLRETAGRSDDIDADAKK